MLRLPAFRLSVPTTVTEAVLLKAEHGAEASYVAGGTDLYPNMKRLQQTPRHGSTSVACPSWVRWIGERKGN
jgi:CO/xanthine dehydrogenase FAD-binding subunit